MSETRGGAEKYSKFFIVSVSGNPSLRSLPYEFGEHGRPKVSYILRGEANLGFFEANSGRPRTSPVFFFLDAQESWVSIPKRVPVQGFANVIGTFSGDYYVVPFKIEDEEYQKMTDVEIQADKLVDVLLERSGKAFFSVEQQDQAAVLLAIVRRQQRFAKVLSQKPEEILGKFPPIVPSGK